MRTEIIHNKDIDRLKWDVFINNSSTGSIFNLSWYLDIVFSKWQALIISDDTGWVTALPLFPKKKWGFNINLQPLLVRYTGAIRNTYDYDSKKLSVTIKDTLSGFSISQFSSNADFLPESTQKKKLTYKLDISLSYDMIFAGFKKSLKNKIRNFNSQGLTITEDKTSSALTELLHHYDEIGKFKLPEDYCEKLEIIYAVAQQKEMAKIVTVRNSDQKVVAAILYFYFGDTIYLFSGLINKEYKSTGIKPYLISLEIEKNAGNYKKLDFLGSMIPGVATFNMSFGAIPHPYHEVVLKKFPFNLMPV